MRWFDAAREALRNHTRDDICDDMRLLGLKAEMAPRGHPEERPGSLGLITIRPGPIEWIEVREIAVEGGTINYAVFGIADARLRDRSLAGFNVESCKARNIPLVGGFVKFSWKGNDLGLARIHR